MKRIIFLSIVTLFAISNYAQIEGFSEDDISLQQPEIPQVEFDKSKYMTPNSDRLDLHDYRIIRKLNEKWDHYNMNVDFTIYDIRGEQIYSISSTEIQIIDHKPIMKEKDLYILSMDSSMQTLGVEHFNDGEYYDVIDIVNTKEEWYEWQQKIDGCTTFIGDTIHHTSINAAGKSKSTIISIKRGDFSTIFWGQDLPTKEKVKEYFPIYKTNAVYILKKGHSYYFVKRDGKEYVRAKGVSTGTFATISDFISVDGFSEMKKCFENKILTYELDTTKLYLCKKIAIKDGKVQGLLEDLSNNQNSFHPIYTYGKGPIIWGFYSYVSDCKSKDEYDYIHVLNNNFCVKSEIDSILHRRELLRKEKERKEKLETQAEQKRIIDTYGEKYGQLINEGKVCVGMTKVMCIEALGSPCQKQSHTDNYGKVEIWTYYCDFFEYGLIDNLMFVTFMDGKVTSITE